jgi:hypothetical protein
VFDSLNPDRITGCALGCMEVLQTTSGEFDSLAVHGAVEGDDSITPDFHQAVAHWPRRRSFGSVLLGEQTASKTVVQGSNPCRSAESVMVVHQAALNTASTSGCAIRFRRSLRMVNVEGSTARLETGARHGVVFESSAILQAIFWKFLCIHFIMESESARVPILFRKQ